jgi:hypothetical protein
MAWRMVKVVVAALLLSSFGVSDLAAGGEHDSGLASSASVADDLVFQSNSEALEHDLKLTAEAHGWTIDEARAVFLAAEAVGTVAVALAEVQPESFVASALGAPGEPPVIYLKGSADEQAVGIIGKSEVPVKVVDNQPYSFDELTKIVELINDDLRLAGYSSYGVGFDARRGAYFEVGIAPQLHGEFGFNGESAEQVANDLVRLASMRGQSIAVQVEIAGQNAVGLTAAFGGMRMSDDGNPECTSGFSVSRISDGVTGITTAGHCTGINQVIHPGHATHATAVKTGHEGLWGDIEWHTTSESEPDDFYSNTSTIRDVESVEPGTGYTYGEPICFYGRSSNSADCSSVVGLSNYSCTPENITKSHLIRMSKFLGIPGDSGGPWYYGNRAFGSHIGYCFNRDIFSIADAFDEAIGVRVRTS